MKIDYKKILKPELLFPLYFYSFILLEPFIMGDKTQSTIILLASTSSILFLFTIGWSLKVFRLNRKLYIYITFCLATFVYNFLFFYNKETENVFYAFVYNGVLAVLFLSGVKNYLEMVKIYGMLSLLVILLFSLDPVIEGSTFHSNYMSYGYYMALPALVGCYLVARAYKKKIYLYAFIYQSVLSIVFANRGVLLSIIFIIGVTELVLSTNKKRILSIFFVFASIAFVINLFLYDILLFISDILYEHDINSYAIDKYINLIASTSGNVSDSSFMSGRDLIWLTANNYIKESPMFGSGYGFLVSKHGYYSHNIFVDLLLEGGAFLLIIHVVWFFFTLRKGFKKRTPIDIKVIILLFLFLCIPKLFFSHQYVIDFGYICFMSTLTLNNK